jgi:hypothetical protein
MKVALLAAAASLVLAFAAHATEPAVAGKLSLTPPSAVCNAGPLQKTSFAMVADRLEGTAFCPQFLSTRIMKLPHHDKRT